MMNVQIRGQRKQLQQKQSKKGNQPELVDQKTATNDIHFMNTQISHPPTMLKKPVLSVAHDNSEETNDMQSQHLDGARIADQYHRLPHKISNAAGPNNPMNLDDQAMREQTQ